VLSWPNNTTNRPKDAGRRYLGIEVMQRSRITLATTEPDTAALKEDNTEPSIQALTA
jgi:hypothetical protein